jgi:hypothetical protein
MKEPCITDKISELHNKLKRLNNELDNYDYSILKKRDFNHGVNTHLRHLILKRDNWKCKNCEVELGNISLLEIHHIDHNTNNNNPKNLITLCRKCHNKI